MVGVAGVGFGLCVLLFALALLHVLRMYVVLLLRFACLRLLFAFALSLFFGRCFVDLLFALCACALAFCDVLLLVAFAFRCLLCALSGMPALAQRY